MHDYYPIIVRAVSRLESNTPNARHELFERVRRILIDQLRIREPPPTGSDFKREREALEEAIRRVDAESVTTRLGNRASIDTPSAKRSRETEGCRKIEAGVTVKGLNRGQAATDDDNPVSLEQIKTRISREPLPTEGQGQSIQWLEVLYERMRALLADPRQQDLLSVPQSKASANAGQQKELERHGLDSHDAASIAASDQRIDTTTARNGAKSFAASLGSKHRIQCLPSSRLSDAFSIHCLDELLRGGAEPLAPESLKWDSNAILRWLAVQNAEALEPKHYEQFTRALRAYMMEWEPPARRQATGTTQLTLSISDEVCAVFGRMLEREQAAVVFDDALTWFANIWIALMLTLNLIIGLILIVAAPAIGAGFGKFLATYSPFNFWCWVCQAFAFSPAVIAIYVKRERLREKEDAHGRAEPAGGSARYRQALRLGRGCMEWLR
jgi:hypothetical protein